MSVDLIRVAGIGNLDLVEKLIKNKADVNFENQYGKTPLIEAAKNGNTEIVQFLLDNKADPSTVDINGENALMHATYWGYKDIVLKLLETDIDVNARDYNKNSAIINCVKARYNQVDVDDINDDNSNENILSTRYPFQSPYNNKFVQDTTINIDILNALIAGSAQGKVTDINIVDEYKKTALIHAVTQADLQAVKIILAAKPNIDHLDSQGNNALLYAAQYNYNDIAAELINAGASVNFLDDFGNTPLTYAVMHHDVSLVKLLLAKGADIKLGYLPSVADEEIQSALAIIKDTIKIETAINEKNYEIVTDILLKSDDIDQYKIQVEDENFTIISNSIKFADSLLFDNKTEIMDFGPGFKIDLAVLKARYEQLLSMPQVDDRTFCQQIDNLSYCYLKDDERVELFKIIQNEYFKRLNDSEKNSDFLNFSSSSLEIMRVSSDSWFSSDSNSQTSSNLNSPRCSSECSSLNNSTDVGVTGEGSYFNNLFGLSLVDSH